MCFSEEINLKVSLFSVFKSIQQKNKRNLEQQTE